MVAEASSAHVLSLRIQGEVSLFDNLACSKEVLLSASRLSVSSTTFLVVVGFRCRQQSNGKMLTVCRSYTNRLAGRRPGGLVS